MKEKYELEFLFKTLPRILENMIATPSGLSEWFADDVNVDDDIYSFEWDGNVEKARMINHKVHTKIRFRWLADEEEDLDTYFEISYLVDPMTSSVAVIITDFAYPEDKDSAILLWDQQIHTLKRLLGA
jgi:hypothetical protein